MNFFTVAPVEKFSEGQAKTVSIAGRKIAVFQRGTEYFALEDQCPHRGASLGQGHICEVAVTCPLHGWQFDLTTGESLTRPGYRVDVFEVKVEEGLVKIALSES